MCGPKDFGGLGLMDTRSMNEALMGKWGWRVLQGNVLQGNRDDVGAPSFGKVWYNLGRF